MSRRRYDTDPNFFRKTSDPTDFGQRRVLVLNPGRPLFFFALLGGLGTAGLTFKRWKVPWLDLGGFFFAVTASHGILDAFTNGGRGVAFFAPFSAQRYFFPVTPIEVSPIGLGFFSNRGVNVLLSEVLWVWCPVIAVMTATRLLQNSKDNNDRAGALKSRR